jgi:hypothetical protein
LNRTGWTAYATSFFDIPYAPIKMIDGDKQTACVTPTTFSFPWEIWFDMGQSMPINAISFQRRQDGPQDSPGPVTISTSSDGVTWTAVASATWINTPNVIVQPIPTTFATWVKVSMLGIAVGARGALSCAEFNAGLSVDTSGGAGGMTLACSCAGKGSGNGCFLIGLTFHGELSITSQNGIGMHAFLELVGGPIGVGIGLTSSAFTSVDIGLVPLGEFRDDWANLSVHFGGEESLFQPPTGGGMALAAGTWWIDQHYNCVDVAAGTSTPQTIRSSTLFGGGNICLSGSITKQVTSIVNGGGTSVLFTSSPLGSCDGGGVGTPMELHFLLCPDRMAT